MNKDSYIFKILEDAESFPYFELFFTTMSDEDQKKFIDIISNIKIDQLYPSLIHGRYHSEKVCLFAFVLGIELGLSDEYLKILCDGAIYHDFMRRNEMEDELHGLASAVNIDRVVGEDPFYKDERRKNLLKAIIDNHSTKRGRQDMGLQLMYESYELDLAKVPFEDFAMLAHALMDADALDRLRFSKASPAYLKPEYLHHEFSKMLVDLAREVNDAYKYYDAYKDIDFSELEKMTGAVCHSAGFVFSRIPFILKYGLLSKAEQEKKKVSTHRNFEGGNSQRWISVVPVELITEGSKINTNFLENGVVIKTKPDVEYYRSNYGPHDSEIALPKGLPYVKGGYSEERFVFERIRPEHIDEVYVSNKCANKDLSELHYIFPNIDFEAYEKMLNYLMEEYNASQSDSMKVRKLFKEYVLIVKDYLSHSRDDIGMVRAKFEKDILACNNEINKVIALIIKKAYTQRFGLFHRVINITPVMVLEDQLLAAGIVFKKVVGKDKVSFVINPEPKKDMTNGATIGSK